MSLCWIQSKDFLWTKKGKKKKEKGSSNIYPFWLICNTHVSLSLRLKACNVRGLWWSHSRPALLSPRVMSSFLKKREVGFRQCDGQLFVEQ